MSYLEPWEEMEQAKHSDQLKRFVFQAEEEKRVEELIRAGHNANPRATVARLPLPAEEKERLKDKVMERLLEPRCASLLGRSRDLYETFLRAQRGGEYR